MRLYTVESNGRQEVAVSHMDTLYLLRDFGFLLPDMNAVIKGGPEVLQEIRDKLASSSLDDSQKIAIENAAVLAPIPVPLQDVVCLGVNYDEHIQETKAISDFTDKPATVYFSKRVNEATGDGGQIAHYDFVDSLDYEVELGVILGCDAKGVLAADAAEYIFGYTIINDFSARNVQMRHSQWYVGKSLDTYTAMGPCIVTADELVDAQNLQLTCKVNGELRQNSNTKYMIQTVAGAIEELSQGITLKAGTIIATGTPGGVGMGMKPPRYLNSGDVVACEIEGIGTLTNVIA